MKNHDNQWYIVFCKPRGEELAVTHLENQGYAVYLPRLLGRHRRLGKWVERIEPLFPRYLFLRPRDETQSLAPVRSTFGVTGLVRFGGQPAVVPDALIEELRARQDAAAGMHVQRTLFQPGAPVKFVDGPFTGLEGVFSQETGEERVIVLLEMLGKMNRLKVDRDWLLPAA
ncbi:MAG: transcription/translation regulatory transformer protein RfaH [Burkholderiales bacterium]|nr:transcription/translation regulatory transformer protein RfaH [Burkholderiales bacterium]